jgi:hypothetical protein
MYDADPIWANFSTQALADVSYVNSVVAAGCANGSQTVKGCVQLATQIQSASSTAFGSTSAALTSNNAYSTSSPGTAGLWNVWTQNDGKIATSFLNGVEQYIWNGLGTFNSGFIDNASSTIAANASNKLTLNALSYIFPSVRGASSSALEENGSGGLTFEPPLPSVISQNNNINASQASTATSTLYSITIPAGDLGSGNSLRLTTNWYSSGGNCVASIGFGTGNATTTIALASQLSVASQFVTTITATSTTSELGMTQVISPEGSLSVSSSVSQSSGYATVNVANQSYLELDMARQAASGATCYAIGYTLELI